MIDPKFLRSDIQEVAEKLLTKNFQLDCESFNLLDSERKSLQSKLEKLLQERNSHAKKIGMKITENGPADNSVKELKIIGEDLKNQSNQIETELSTVSDHSIETDESNSSPSNGLENFDFDEETPELFNSDGSITETDEETSLINEVNETKEEEDDLEIPAFLRRQKN